MYGILIWQLFGISLENWTKVFFIISAFISFFFKDTFCQKITIMEAGTFEKWKSWEINQVYCHLLLNCCRKFQFSQENHFLFWNWWCQYEIGKHWCQFYHHHLTCHFQYCWHILLPSPMVFWGLLNQGFLYGQHQQFYRCWWLCESLSLYQILGGGLVVFIGMVLEHSVEF